MARIVQCSATEPYALTPRQRSVWLCQCGLSQNKPFCDGSHAVAQKEPSETLCVYHPVTLKPLCQLPPLDMADIAKGLRQQMVVHREGRITVTWLTPASPLFAEVRRIRLAMNGGDEASAMDACDLTADHYLLFDEGRPVATMRANQAKRGALDCEEFYPPSLLEGWRHCVASASRLARDPSIAPCPASILRFIREVWRHQYQQGIRADLINCHEPMERFYLRLGYRRIPDSGFLHPRLATPSLVMVLVADPNAKTPLQDAFGGHGSEADDVTELLEATLELGVRMQPPEDRTNNKNPLL